MFLYFKKHIFIFACFVLSGSLFSQSSFEIMSSKKQVKIPYDLVSNLVVIPVKLNGVELTFLLDTGVRETILFNVSKVDSLMLNNAKTFTVKGANDIKVTALKSKNNVLEIEGLKSTDHDIYVAFNQDTNLSSYLGEEIHGILGYHFFKDFVAEISYTKGFVRIMRKGTYRNKWNRYTSVDLTFSRGKPYVVAKIRGEKRVLLLDTGMSDGVWMFKEDSLSTINYGYYKDFLGMSVSGEILGKRSKIEELDFAGETFKNVKISYPDEATLPKEIKGFKDRAGSIGGELLKRFTVVLDYPNSKMYLKPNSHLSDPFYYNKSGIILRQDGEAVQNNSNKELLKNLEADNFISFVDLTYLLSPEFIIDIVRKGSPADLAGLQKNDILLEVNGSKTFHFTLKKINRHFYDEDDTLVQLKIERNGRVLKKEFKLKSPLKKLAN